MTIDTCGLTCSTNNGIETNAGHGGIVGAAGAGGTPGCTGSGGNAGPGVFRSRAWIDFSPNGSYVDAIGGSESTGPTDCGAPGRGGDLFFDTCAAWGLAEIGTTGYNSGPGYPSGNGADGTISRTTSQSCCITPTPTITGTLTQTPTISDTPTETPTVTATPTIIDTPTQTATITDTPTNTPTDTPMQTPTQTPTHTPIATSTQTNTPPATSTATQTATVTDTPASTPTPTDTPTSTSTNTATPTGTVAQTAPQATIQEVQGGLEALLAQLDDKEDRSKLSDAIAHLQRALQDDRWLDDSHLKPGTKGEGVFNETKAAVVKLKELRNNNDSGLDPELIQSYIDTLVGNDRELAELMIAGAQARGGNAGKIKTANEELKKGDAEAARDHADKAIDHYKNAWENAIAV